MTEIGSAPLKSARSVASISRSLALVAIILILINVIFVHGIVAPLRSLAELDHPPMLGPLWWFGAVLPQIPLALPSLLLIGALEKLRDALKEYEEGRAFSLASAHAVRLSGQYAAAALIAKVAIAPVFKSILEGRYRWEFNYETTDLAWFAFALFVFALGRVLEAASAIKQENDEIV
jgi:hypothetical protein